MCPISLLKAGQIETGLLSKRDGRMNVSVWYDGGFVKEKK